MLQYAAVVMSISGTNERHRKDSVDRAKIFGPKVKCGEAEEPRSRGQGVVQDEGITGGFRVWT